MFALWYGTLFYREYRDIIWAKLSKQQLTTPVAKETAVVTPLPLKKPEPNQTRIPVAEPTKVQIPPPSNIPAGPPISRSPVPVNPPKNPDNIKTPRSPSPHPIRTETFEEMKYEDEEDDDEEDDGEEESSDIEDEENSVISASPRGPVSNSVKEFINQEINSQNKT